MSTTLGQLMFTRRRNLGLSLRAMSDDMGGSPSESYLWRVENGMAGMSATLAVRLAKTLRLPEEAILNAAGHVNSKQQRDALNRLLELIGEPAPIEVALPVYDPDLGETRERSTHVLKNREAGFVVRLTGQRESMFDGECVVLTGRQPTIGQGVIIRHNDRLSAAIFAGDHVMRGDERIDAPEILGVIVRVVTSHNFE